MEADDPLVEVAAPAPAALRLLLEEDLEVADALLLRLPACSKVVKEHVVVVVGATEHNWGE